MLVSRKDSSVREDQQHSGPDARSADMAAARKAAIERTRGMYAHLAPGHSVVDGLIADRRAEARAEDLQEAERRRQENS
jgi:hypothetical protein